MTTKIPSLKTLSVAFVALTLGGCASFNEVRPSHVTMETGGANYEADAEHCRKIAESKDHFNEAMKKAVVRGVVVGVSGGIAGAVVGNQFGSASAGAAAGSALAVGSAIATSPLQEQTATTVWARCMAAHGHAVYAISLH